MNRYYLIAAIVAVAVASSLITAMFVPVGAVLIDGPKLSANVYVKAERADGTVVLEETHNAVANVTRNITVRCLMRGTVCGINNFTWIALGNGTTANGDAVTALGGEIPIGCASGLDRVNASSTADINTSGVMNISQSYTWTVAAGSLEVNRTALFNNSTAGTIGFTANFTKVTLNAGDKINAF